MIDFYSCKSPIDFKRLHDHSLNELIHGSWGDIPENFKLACRCILANPNYWSVIDGTHKPNIELFDEVNAILELPNVINCRDNYYYDIVIGILFYLKRDYKNSFLSFSRIAKFNDFYRISKDDFGGGASFCRAWPSSEWFYKIKNLPVKYLIYKESSIDQDFPAYLISFDYVYFKAFSLSWVDRLVKSSSYINLVFFVSIREGDPIVEFDLLINHASANGINVSIYYEILSEIKDRAWYTSSRFLFAPTLLSQYSKGLFIVDADMIVNDFNFYLNLPSDVVSASINVGPYNGGYLPWRSINAGSIFLPQTKNSFEYLDVVGKFITYFWDYRVNRNWWIDQFSLESARIYLKLDMFRADDIFWNSMTTSEHYKISMVSQVEEVKNLLDSGKGFIESLLILNNRA
jgi:hypothetical protein